MELLGNQMAAANLIREALMALLKAKKSNVSAQGTKNQIRKQGFDDFDDSSPRNPDAIELADDAAENLQKARQGAQEIQGTDPLTAPAYSAFDDYVGEVPGASSKDLLGMDLGLRKANRNYLDEAEQGTSYTDAWRRTGDLDKSLGRLPVAEGRMTLPPEIAQQLKGIEDDIGKGAGIKEVLDRLAKLDDAGYHKYTDDIIDRLLSQTKTSDVSDIPF